MPDHRDYFRQRKQSSAQGQHYRRLDEERFETSQVNFLCTRLRLPASLRHELYRRTSITTGRRVLRMVDFNERLPSFPLLLGCSLLDGIKLHREVSATLPACIKTFQATPFYKAYENFYEQNEDEAQGRALGLIFRRQGFRQGLLLYNGLISDFWHPGGGLFYRGGSPEDPLNLFVVSFASVVDAIGPVGHGWQPAPGEL